MTRLANDTVWRRRMGNIDNHVQDIHLPTMNSHGMDLDQNEEWCEVVIENEKRRIRFHDYDQVFQIPGLYEELFYGKLECCSPSYVVNLLEDVAGERGIDPGNLKVLDVGAGNGMVGDELKHHGVKKVVGVDILEEAKEAAQRDRPRVYEDYRVADLTDLPEHDEQAIKKHGLNCLTTVAALGYGDIPPEAFLKALDLIATPAWLAFNIKEDFLRDRDSSGFSRLIQRLISEGYIQPQCYRRYRHRLSVAGEPLYYIAMIAKKLRAVPPSLSAAQSN
jgi:SAM-dependent methyltransferase